MAHSAEAIEPISHSQFASLLGTRVLNQAADPGCAWYVTADRRVVASLHLDSAEEKWRFVTYCCKRKEWKRQGSPLYDNFEAAQEALLSDLQALSSPAITTIEKPFRLRFGRKPR